MQQNPVNFIDPWGLWTYATEYGTTGAGLTTNITSIEGSVDYAFRHYAQRDAVVTYTTNGTHGANSLHYTGNAIDLRTNDMSLGDVFGVVDMLRAWFDDYYDIIDEGTHIHLEYDPPTC